MVYSFQGNTKSTAAKTTEFDVRTYSLDKVDEPAIYITD